MGRIELAGGGCRGLIWSGHDTFRGGVSVVVMMENRNLRSVTLNLKSKRGVEAARRLVETADVMVENFRPDVMDRLGLGYEDMRKLKPDIIYASGSGYGGDGPYSHLPGQDLLIQAISGLGANTGTEEQGPTVAGAAVVDQHSASLLAMGILADLVNRGLTGARRNVELVMMQEPLDLEPDQDVEQLNVSQLALPTAAVAATVPCVPAGV